MLEQLMEFVQIGGLPVLFFLLFWEGNPLVGSFIPGQVIIVLVGFLIGTSGIFPFWLALIVIFFAAFLGDYMAYYLGKKCGLGFLQKFGLKKDSCLLKASNKFFKKFGAWSLVLGREIAFTRAFMPFLAGMGNMSQKKFLLFGFISNIFFAFVSLFLGYYFGGIVVEKMQFFFSFLFFVIIYFGVLFLIYKSFLKFYEKNHVLIRRYALINIFFGTLFMISILIFTLFSKTGGYILVDDFVLAVKLISFFEYFSFLLEPIFWVFLFFMFLITLLLFRKIRLFFISMWSFAVVSFATLSFGFLFRNWFGIGLKSSIIFLVLFIFYLWIFGRDVIENKKSRVFFEVFLVLVTLFFVLVKIYFSYNVYHDIISFLFGGLLCEAILILSHYEFLAEDLSMAVMKSDD